MGKICTFLFATVFLLALDFSSSMRDMDNYIINPDKNDNDGNYGDDNNNDNYGNGNGDNYGNNGDDDNYGNNGGNDNYGNNGDDDDDNVQRPGGLGEIEQPNDEVRNMVKALATSIRGSICTATDPKPPQKACKSKAPLRVLSFRKQVVNGYNYFVKIQFGQKEFYYIVKIYVMAYDDQYNKVQLVGIHEADGDANNIKYFE